MSNPDTTSEPEAAVEPTVTEKLEAILARHDYDIIGTAPALWQDLKALVAANKPAEPAAEPEASA